MEADLRDDSVQQLRELIAADGRYSLCAYAFVFDALRAATEGSAERDPTPRHVSGAEICHAAAELARRTWGPLADLVLSRWGVRQTRDLGEMVFRLIDLGLLGKQESDTIADFDNVLDLSRLGSGYRPCVDALGRPE